VADEHFLEKAGRLPKELVDVACPRCGFRISQDSEVAYNREDAYIVGYTLTCPQCGNEFMYTLYFK
jgi:DNA-directed RNA polymerase subunit RPC12/RpoP